MDAPAPTTRFRFTTICIAVWATAGLLLYWLGFYSVVYPHNVTDLHELRIHDWRRIGDNQKISFLNGAYVDTVEIVHPFADWRSMQKIGDRYRFRFSKGLSFTIGPEPRTGPPVIKEHLVACDVRVVAESPTEFTIDGPDCDWLTGRYRKWTSREAYGLRPR